MKRIYKVSAFTLALGSLLLAVATPTRTRATQRQAMPCGERFVREHINERFT
jgi:hypothetical protein